MNDVSQYQKRKLLKSERNAGDFGIQVVKSSRTHFSPCTVVVDFEASGITGSVGSVTSESNRH